MEGVVADADARASTPTRGSALHASLSEPSITTLEESSDRPASRGRPASSVLPEIPESLFGRPTTAANGVLCGRTAVVSTPERMRGSGTSTLSSSLSASSFASGPELSTYGQKGAADPHAGTIGLDDFLAVIGPIPGKQQGVVRSVFLRHTGGFDSATWVQFGSIFEEISPAAVVRENLWSSMRKFRKASVAPGGRVKALDPAERGGTMDPAPFFLTGVGPRGESPRSGAQDQWTFRLLREKRRWDGQNKLIDTLKAKNRDLSRQVQLGKSVLKLEAELVALRALNGTLQKERVEFGNKLCEQKEMMDEQREKALAAKEKLWLKLMEAKNNEMKKLRKELEGKTYEVEFLHEKLKDSLAKELARGGR